MNPIRGLLHALLGDDSPRERNPDELVRLPSGLNDFLANEVELRAWADILRKRAIRCEVEPVGVGGAFGSAINEFAILVRQCDVAPARTLLGLDPGEAQIP